MNEHVSHRWDTRVQGAPAEIYSRGEKIIYNHETTTKKYNVLKPSTLKYEVIFISMYQIIEAKSPRGGR